VENVGSTPLRARARYTLYVMKPVELSLLFALLACGVVLPWLALAAARVLGW
jgi:hypothetical protein